MLWPSCGSVNFITFFLYTGYTPLHLAVLKDSVTAVERLCFAGCDVNSRDRKTGRTALHMAVERSNLNIVDVLLNKVRHFLALI